MNGTVYSYGALPSGISLTAPTTTASFTPSLNRDGLAPTILGSANSETVSVSILRLGLGIGLGVGLPILLAIVAGVLVLLLRRSKDVSFHDKEVLAHEPAKAIPSFRLLVNREVLKLMSFLQTS